MEAFRERENVPSAAYQQKLQLIIRFGQSLKTASKQNTGICNF
jgi:hypothetical protein